MEIDSIKKYRPYPQVDLPDRIWPSNTLTQSPIWCSVDLRDGNQALITPMNLEEKIELFNLLVKLGFKEIEIGFPSASQVEFNFLRTLIEKNMIPDDVTIQVLVQAREHLIEKTFESLRGVKKAIVHLYNSTSVAQRKIVFQKDKDEIIALALQGVAWIKKQTKNSDSKISLQYSPESFTGTELEFARDICNEVIEAWGADAQNKIIINLPSTVEMSTPNIYADQIEWMSRSLKRREHVIISAHTHNDRGTSIAASELAQLAGAQRVEGTLLSNGERTGNVDIITLALNLASQGIDPKLNFSDVNEVVEVVEQVTRMKTHPRHPYVGDLVYTAFSGSHQDAINKGLAYQRAQKEHAPWEVPYLPIDPSDVGRTYEDIIRINSQSGKGGVAYVLDDSYGYHLPKKMYPEVGRLIQSYTDKTGQEIDKDSIVKIFEEHYCEPKKHLELIDFAINSESSRKKSVSVSIIFNIDNKETTAEATGNGPIDACVNAIRKVYEKEFVVLNYTEHSRGERSDAEAVAYIQIQTPDFNTQFGVGKDTDITIASIKALFSSLNLAFSS